MRFSALVMSFEIALLVGCSDSPDNSKAVQPPRAPAPPVAVERDMESTEVIAYYFHGTVRCETCLQIEKQAHELISSRFAGQVVFKPVNYDKPENAHFSKDYKLPCPSLVLVRQKEGKDQEWRLLGQTWDHVQIPPKLDQYIEDETIKFLEVAKWLFSKHDLWAGRAYLHPFGSIRVKPPRKLIVAASRRQSV